MPLQGELGRLNPNDPNYVLELAVGPPAPNLVPQNPATGPRMSGHYLQQPGRFILKKAHLSADDFRIFDGSGRLMAVSHHLGKNPYGELDPLGMMPQQQLGEWNSMMNVSGYHGMPSFKIRPKGLSRHGRQLIQEYGGKHTLFNVAKQSRLSTMSIRHNYEVCAGDTDTAMYSVLCDLAGRTMNIVNEREETAIFVQKSAKTMIMNAALGAGSELLIDVAPGVDWTAAIAVVLGIQQVGAHFVKDAFSSFVVNPLQGAAMDQAVEMTGTQGIMNQFTHTQGSVVNFAHTAQRIQSEFFR